MYIFINLIVGCIAILTPYLTGNFIDNLIAGKGIESVYNFCIILASISLVKIVLGYCTTMIYTKMQANMAYEFNKDVVFHIQELSLSYINKSNSTYLNQIVNNDSNALIIFCVTVIQNFILNTVYLVVPLYMIFRINALITSILLIFAIIYLLLFIVFKKPLYNINLKLKESQSLFFSKLYEQFQFIRFIKVQSVENEFRDRLNNGFNSLLSSTVKMQRLSYFYSSLDGLVSLAAQITLYLIGGIQIINGHFTIGMFTIFFSYFNMILGSTRYFFMFGKSYQDTLVSYNRLTAIINEKKETSGAEQLKNISSISVRNLCFSYNTKQIINNADFNFEKGMVYGIIGENGSGKSTLINLLLGLYINEKQGEIYYNNHNIENTDMKLIRKNEIGVSEQEPVLINDTIHYNLFVGLDGTIESCNEKINYYSQILNFYEYINKLPNQFEMPINERNNNLSGGEKQKLSILRVLIKNPSVMIFDEPTSALDAKSTEQFISHLISIKNDKIIILITHNKSFIDKCDVIYKLM